MTDERDGNLGEVIDRRVQVYGDPVTGFAEIAQMWTVLFDVDVPAWKVPIAQALMKVVRMKNSPDYSDHSDDIEGYLDIFRKVIGPDMIHARTVNEYIEKKWPVRTVKMPTEPAVCEHGVDVATHFCSQCDRPTFTNDVGLESADQPIPYQPTDRDLPGWDGTL